MKPFIVIGYYKPTRPYSAKRIGTEILASIAHLKLKPHVDPVHGPQECSIWCSVPLHAEVRRYAQHAQGSGWHQDGDLQPGSIMDHAAVLWSEITPTEFKTPDGLIWRPKPCEIVLSRNLSCHHRSPPDAPMPPEVRWFFRQRVAVPHHLELP